MSDASVWLSSHFMLSLRDSVSLATCLGSFRAHLFCLCMTLCYHQLYPCVLQCHACLCTCLACLHGFWARSSRVSLLLASTVVFMPLRMPDTSLCPRRTRSASKTVHRICVVFCISSIQLRACTVTVAHSNHLAGV